MVFRMLMRKEGKQKLTKVNLIKLEDLFAVAGLRLLFD